jgi:hypothetical protein
MSSYYWVGFPFDNLCVVDWQITPFNTTDESEDVAIDIAISENADVFKS